MPESIDCWTCVEDVVGKDEGEDEETELNGKERVSARVEIEISRSVVRSQLLISTPQLQNSMQIDE